MTPNDQLPYAPSDAELAEYLAGSLDASHRARIDAWVDVSLARREELLLLHRTLQREATASVSRATAGLGAALRAQAEIERRYGQMALSSGRRSQGAGGAEARGGAPSAFRHWSPMLVAAASAILASVFWWDGWHRSEPAGRLHVYRTAAGERATLPLVDGTRVILAPRTTLALHEPFGTSRRVVSLTGEAYFEVTSSRQAPFIVQTGSVETRVLGTTFDVRHYAEDRTVEVAVTSGKVVVRRKSGTPGIALTTGKVARVTDSSATVITLDNVSAYTRWTTGTLVFRDAPTPQVLQAVGRWYGYTFRIADSTIVNDYVTASFGGRSGPDVLAALARVLDVTMTLDGHIVTLHARHGASTIERSTVRDSFTTSSLGVGR